MALLLVSAFLFAAPALAQVATWGQCEYFASYCYHESVADTPI